MKRQLASLLLAFCLTSTSALADVVLRIGTLMPATSQQGLATDAFAKAVNDAGIGVDIRIFPASQLGGGDVQMQNVKQGIQDGIIEDLNWMSTFSPNMRISNTPFLFRDFEQLSAWIRSPAFEPLKQDMIDNGNQVLYPGETLWQRGPYRVLMSTKPITSLADLPSTRLRMYSNEIVQRFWGAKGFGANTITIAWSEIYLAISQGTVDALTASIDQVVPNRFGEVAKHMTRTDEFPQIVALSINKNKWDALSAEQQQAIQNAWNEAGKGLNEALARDLDAWNAELKAMGVTTHELDKEAFMARASEIVDELIAEGVLDAAAVEGIRSIK